MQETRTYPIDPEISPLIYIENKRGHIFGRSPQEAFDDVIRCRLQGIPCELIFMGGNGSGKTQRSGEGLAHLERWFPGNFPHNVQSWWGRRGDWPNLYYLPLEQAQRTASDYNRVWTSPGQQSPADYKKSSIIMSHASAQALMIGGTVIDEAQGFAGRGTFHNESISRGSGIYKGLRYKVFYYLSVGNEQVFKLAQHQRQKREVKIGSDRRAVLSEARGGVYSAMVKYYEEEAIFFREILEICVRRANCPPDLKFFSEYLERFSLRYPDLNPFINDFELRKEFMVRCLPEAYFKNLLGLSEEQIARQVCITEMPFVQDLPDYSELLNSYDLLKQLRARKHLDRKVPPKNGRKRTIRVLRAVNPYEPTDGEPFTPIRSFYKPATF